jgi:hypothetical protein
MMARKIRRAWIHIVIDTHVLWASLVEMVDSRTVRLFQAIMYFFFFLNGAYAAFFAEPVSVVDKAMGTATYDIWVWLNVICPVMVAFGCWLTRPRGPTGLTRKATNGLLLQVFGDLGMTFTLAAYWMSILASSWWGKGTTALWGYMGLSLCAALLTVGDIRRLVVRSEWSPR